MEAYRDQYATLFNNGRRVVVLAVSADADTTQAAWARESGFPFVFASDSAGAVGTTYGAWVPQNRVDNRHLFVIDSAGRVAYVARPFRIMAQDAYTELGAVIDRLSPPPVAADSGQ